MAYYNTTYRRPSATKLASPKQVALIQRLVTEKAIPAVSQEWMNSVLDHIAAGDLTAMVAGNAIDHLFNFKNVVVAPSTLAMSFDANTPASEKQLEWIAKLPAQKAIPASEVEAIERLKWIGIDKAHAGRILDYLFAAADGAGDIEGTPVTEAGLYIADGTVYKVQISRSSGKAYAKKLVINVETGRGSFDFEAGAMRFLRAEHAITAESARAFGLATGFCARCGDRLEDPVSVALGLGPVCGPKLMGKAAHKEAVKVAMADPEIAAAVKAREERRDAARV